MHSVPGNGWRGAAAALLRSYTSDLRGWVGRLATGYSVAVALLVGGVLALFAAIAVGITALFDFLQRTFGIEFAYGSIGSGLLVLAIVLFLIGWMMLRRKAPPVPRPHRQAQAAKQALVGPAAWRAIGSRLGTEAVQTDPATRLLFGAAATILAGWIVASRFRSSGRTGEVRR
jgi:hypothetical protein